MSNEPGIVWVKPWGEDQGNYVRINESDFDPAIHVQVDENGEPLDVADETDSVDERGALRAEYEAVLGKKPYMGWDADTLRAKIAAKSAAPND